MKILKTILISLSTPLGAYAQGCCSGGSGSPIAGGASQGVLQDRQMEIAANYQYLNSDRFKTRDKDTAQLFASYQTQYLYYKLAYGVTKDLTISLEAGYFLHKTQTGLFDSTLNKSEIIQSSGIADLIIFPRYDVINRTTETKRIELTLGLGYKIPLGKYNDSMLVYTNPNTGQQIFTTAPPLVQPTNGSQDLIGYAFFYRGFPQKDFRLFANVLYIRKGWNPLGEKFGDYASLGLFAGKTFFKKLGLTLQIKGEYLAKMKAAKNIDLLALYNVDTASTGSKKISFVPQLSFSYKSFTVFALADLPLYEYVYGTQVASRHQFTFGISYRFFTYRSIVPKNTGTFYECPMKCKGYTSKEPGKCPECGMDLIKQ
jgi:hypothetical protein